MTEITDPEERSLMTRLEIVEEAGKRFITVTAPDRMLAADRLASRGLVRLDTSAINSGILLVERVATQPSAQPSIFGGAA